MLWNSVEELFDEAFNCPKVHPTFMSESDARTMYFKLLSKYKDLKADYRLLEHQHKHLEHEFSSLSRKYRVITKSSDVVPGHIYRKLNSEYRVLSNDYSKLLEANIKLSTELTYTKLGQFEEDNS